MFSEENLEWEYEQDGLIKIVNEPDNFTLVKLINSASSLSKHALRNYPLSDAHYIQIQSFTAMLRLNPF